MCVIMFVNEYLLMNVGRSTTVCVCVCVCVL